MTQPIAWLTTAAPTTADQDQIGAAARNAAQVIEQQARLDGLSTITIDTSQPFTGAVDDQVCTWMSAPRTAGCAHATDPGALAGILLQPGVVWCWDCWSAGTHLVDQALDHPDCWGCDLPSDAGYSALLITHGPIVIQGLICADCIEEIWT